MKDADSLERIGRLGGPFHTISFGSGKLDRRLCSLQYHGAFLGLSSSRRPTRFWAIGDQRNTSVNRPDRRRQQPSELGGRDETILAPHILCAGQCAVEISCCAD